MKLVKQKFLKIGLAIIGGWLLVWMMFIHHVEPTEVAIRWNPFTGETSIDTVPGYYVTSPLTTVAKITTQPTRVCITSSSRSVSCKLVKFEPCGWKKFVQIEGFHYYWWYNRFSFNFGYDDEYRGIKDILRGYAYGNEHYDFLTVIDDSYSGNK